MPKDWLSKNENGAARISRKRRGRAEDGLDDVDGPDLEACGVAPRLARKASGAGRTQEAEVRRVFAESLPEIAAVIAEKAKCGDAAAARLIFEFYRPKPGERQINFKLRAIENAEDAAAAISDVLQAAASGRLSLGEAREIVALLRTMVDLHELAPFGSSEARRAFKTREVQRLKDARRHIDRLDQRDFEEQEPIDWDEEAERLYQEALAGAAALGQTDIAAET